MVPKTTVTSNAVTLEVQGRRRSPPGGEKRPDRRLPGSRECVVGPKGVWVCVGVRARPQVQTGDALPIERQ